MRVYGGIGIHNGFKLRRFGLGVRLPLGAPFRKEHYGNPKPNATAGSSAASRSNAAAAKL